MKKKLDEIAQLDNDEGEETDVEKDTETSAADETNETDGTEGSIISRIEEAASTPLDNKVAEMIKSNAQSESDEDVESWLKDLFEHGCQSGMVGDLVYYTDTVAFHDEFEDDIWELAGSQADEMGSGNVINFIGDLNGAENVVSCAQFKNLLAWFAFEETARKLASSAGLEI